MHLDTILTVSSFKDVAQLARTVEDVGFDALWSLENRHEPFMPLAVAASATEKLHLGTSIALAFVRSPMNLAYTAWDLQAGSNGRFILGLGTQVKGHNERRYSVKWESPGPKLRELVQALRAIWDCWQNGTRLNFNGKFYSFTLMPPAFSPDKIAHPHVPIYVAGVNPYMCRLAGEVGDGFHVHPFHSTKYLRDSVLPQIKEGARKAGRSPADVSIVLIMHCCVCADRSVALRSVKRTLSFYGRMPFYNRLFARQGYVKEAEAITAGWTKGDAKAAADAVSDQMAEQVAAFGSAQDCQKKVEEFEKAGASYVVLYPTAIDGDYDRGVKAVLAAFGG